MGRRLSAWQATGRVCAAGLAVPLCFLLTTTLLLGAGAVAAAELQGVEIEGTAFKVSLGDGRVLRSPDLVGATLTISTSEGVRRVRIEAVERDATVADPVWLHTFATETPDGSWRNPCVPGPDGRSRGFPLAGRLAADGTMAASGPETFELVCTSGGRGKCVRLGYRPWTDSAMRDLFNACVRLLRADYCGDGGSTTRNGTLVDLYDDRGIQKPEHGDGLEFEAGWSAHGAVCVRHVRIKENISPDALAARCPRLKDRVGSMCTEEAARKLGATIYNGSKP